MKIEQLSVDYIISFGEKSYVIPDALNSDG